MNVFLLSSLWCNRNRNHIWTANIPVCLQEATMLYFNAISTISFFDSTCLSENPKHASASKTQVNDALGANAHPYCEQTLFHRLPKTISGSFFFLHLWFNRTGWRCVFRDSPEPFGQIGMIGPNAALSESSEVLWTPSLVKITPKTHFCLLFKDLKCAVDPTKCKKHFLVFQKLRLMRRILCVIQPRNKLLIELQHSSWFYMVLLQQ